MEKKKNRGDQTTTEQRDKKKSSTQTHGDNTGVREREGMSTLIFRQHTHTHSSVDVVYVKIKVGERRNKRE